MRKAKDFVHLTYFNVRGKAESIRLLLEDQNIPYKENRYTPEEWKTVKPTLPFKQLPLYEERENNIYIVQTQAILRYLGRKHDLYGVTENDRIRCDILQEAILDAREELIKLFADKEFEMKRDRFKNEFLPNRMERLNTFFEKNRSVEFSVGSKTTYVDYLLWVYLDYVRAFSLPTLQGFDSLYQFKMNLEKRKGVAEYLKSDRRPPVYTLPHFKFGNTPETS
jgi:glutathione S-transferase